MITSTQVFKRLPESSTYLLRTSLYVSSTLHDEGTILVTPVGKDYVSSTYLLRTSLYTNLQNTLSDMRYTTRYVRDTPEIRQRYCQRCVGGHGKMRDEDDGIRTRLWEETYTEERACVRAGCKARIFFANSSCCSRWCSRPILSLYCVSLYSSPNTAPLPIWTTISGPPRFSKGSPFSKTWG